MSNKTLILPENINEITLGQYQRFELLNKRTDLNELSYNKRVIEIFTELKYRDIGNISNKDYNDILLQLNTAMNQECKFENTFKIQDVEFGFIPNFDDLGTDEQQALNTGEYIDGIGYLEVENFHKLMAVLFRPITKRDKFGNYEIESYNGTKHYASIMKLMPMNIVNGALGFFFQLSNELREHIQRSTAEVERLKVVRHQDISRNGVGIAQ